MFSIGSFLLIYLIFVFFLALCCYWCLQRQTILLIQKIIMIMLMNVSISWLSSGKMLPETEGFLLTILDEVILIWNYLNYLRPFVKSYFTWIQCKITFITSSVSGESGVLRFFMVYQYVDSYKEDRFYDFFQQLAQTEQLVIVNIVSTGPIHFKLKEWRTSVYLIIIFRKLKHIKQVHNYIHFLSTSIYFGKRSQGALPCSNRT